MTSALDGPHEGRGGCRAARPAYTSRRAAGAAHHLPSGRPCSAVRRGRVDRRPSSCRGGEGGNRSAGPGDRSWLEPARGRLRISGHRRVARRVRERHRRRTGRCRRPRRRHRRRWRRPAGARPSNGRGVGDGIRVGGRRSGIRRRRGADERRRTRIRHGRGTHRRRCLRSRRRVRPRGSISIHRPNGCGHERDVSRRATSACASAGPT